MRWIFPPSSAPGTPLLERVLSARGQTMADFDWDETKLDSLSLLYNCDLAAKVIIEAVKKGKKIFVHGDYDVDGVCSTAIVWEFLYRELKADVHPYIPSRFDEGYGLSHASVDAMLAEGAELIITVDCGVKDIDIVSKYSQLGLEFVITDHHALHASGRLPAAAAVVHPLYPKHQSDFEEICAATVAWKLCCVINQKLNLGVQMSKWLDLVALATVCDVMPLYKENRALVIVGVAQMKLGQRLGLAELAKVAGFDIQQVQHYQLGYTLGPRLNAAGRMGTALTALRLLVTTSASQARALAQELEDLNQQRQAVTLEVLTTAESRIDSRQQLLVLYDASWPEGVIGLAAGKLAEKYSRPVFIGSQIDEEIKFSARSIDGFHLANNLSTLADLLIRFGGHALAAGATLAAKDFAVFESRLQQLVAKLDSTDLEPRLTIDLVAGQGDITPETVNELEKLAPFGMGNPKPVVVIPHVRLVRQFKFGKEGQHQKFVVRTGWGEVIELIDFNAQVSWPEAENAVDVAGHLDLNEWQGTQSVRLMLRDVRAGNTKF